MRPSEFVEYDVAVKQSRLQLRHAGRFDTTRWSVVLRASDTTADGHLALSSLIDAYWYPLYAFARRRGHGDHDAMDLTQGFLAQLMDTEALASVSPEKGRFRTFLLASFSNYMSNQRRAANALRRGGGAITLPIDAGEFQSRYDREPADTDTPELLYQRSFVQTLLEKVRTRLAEEYGHAGRAELFALLEPHLTFQPEAVSREQIGQRLKLSPAAVNMSLHRMRRRYGDVLRDEVMQLVNDPAEVEDELRVMMELMSR